MYNQYLTKYGLSYYLINLHFPETNLWHNVDYLDSFLWPTKFRFLHSMEGLNSWRCAVCSSPTTISSQLFSYHHNIQHIFLINGYNQIKFAIDKPKFFGKLYFFYLNKHVDLDCSRGNSLLRNPVHHQENFYGFFRNLMEILLFKQKFRTLFQRAIHSWRLFTLRLNSKRSQQNIRSFCRR